MFAGYNRMLSYSIFVLICVYFSYQDIVYGEIKRIYLYAAIAVALCVKAPATAWESFGGAVIGMLLFALAYHISGFIGAFLGIIKWYAAVSIGCILALLFFICSRNKLKELPFIPFLSIGACVVELTVLLCGLNT